MNYKQLLKFYFRADRLNIALDSLAMRYATKSASCAHSWEYYADNICRIGEVKIALGELWAFLDWAMSTVTESDRATLEKYSAGRARAGKKSHCLACGENKGNCGCGGGEEGASGCEGGKALHRSLMKFSRRVGGRMGRFAEQVKVLREYFCFIASP